MSKRWSKLQSRLYNLMEPSLNFQIHCSLYEMNSNDGWHGNKLPRYFITIGKEIIFDYPKDFKTSTYPWQTEIGHISDLIEAYIQCPERDIMFTFDDDSLGVTDILRVCDRRLGRRRLEVLKDNTEDELILRIINKRLSK